MAGGLVRGKLIAVIGDEDTCTGFLLGGIGELNKNRKPNFLVVEKETSVTEIEETFSLGPRNRILCRAGTPPPPLSGEDRNRGGEIAPWSRCRTGARREHCSIQEFSTA
ncbi:V-type proton ATPase subunit F isoform X3 [Dendrobates tinctorius]|uniref:V-type proton ATPase subunit F isoform X3 n=1 Tax=Dendrobates tinctorius TaxID=92724 RepID=UPI003CC92577